MRGWGLGFRDFGVSGFRAWDLGFRFWGLWFEGLGFDSQLLERSENCNPPRPFLQKDKRVAFFGVEPSKIRCLI